MGWELVFFFITHMDYGACKHPKVTCNVSMLNALVLILNLLQHIH